MIKINDRFGKLIVIKEIKSKNKKDYHKKYICKCDCGNIIEVRGTCLRNGEKSCGCINKENFIKNITKHKMYGSRIYNIWNGILSRTKYKSKKDKKRYWGRGISICKEWENFENFYKWAIKNGYNENLTIDRIDNNGNYCHENCRWVTRKEQANNKSSNIIINFNNKTMTKTEWAKYLNISIQALSKRLIKWNLEDALTKIGRTDYLWRNKI